MAAKNVYKKGLLLMGNNFEISVVAHDEFWAFEKIELAVAEIQRIEKILTTYNDQSETNLINSNAGIKPVKVSMETIQLIQRSIRISEITQGALILVMVQWIKASGILIQKCNHCQMQEQPRKWFV